MGIVLSCEEAALMFEAIRAQAEAEPKRRRKGA